jgi:DNA-binding transcriptional LysR family regulator
MLDVRRMRVLREVAIHGSMSGAADALGYTASAISQQVAALERETGVALVERGPRSVILTDAGRTLVEHAEAVLAQLDHAEEEMRAIAGLRGGRVRIATFRSAAETVVADAITQFHARFPGVELTLSEGEPEEYLPRLAAGELDLATSFEYDRVTALERRNLVLEPLLEEPMWLALPIDHPLLEHDAIELSALAGEPWIGSTPRSSVHDFTPNVCRAAGFEPRFAAQTDDYHVCQALVASGLGVAFIPGLSLRTRHPQVAVRLLEPRSPTRRIFAAYRPGADSSPALSAMLGVLREVCAEPRVAVQAEDVHLR